jgi:hypothetical protein
MDNQPSTYHHSEFVKKFNNDMRQAQAQGAAAIDLSPDALIAEARKETGLQRFRDDSFMPAMRILLEAVEAEAELNPFGRFVAKSRTLRALKNRLWADACFEAHPEILERKIVAPIIIVGPHRSGTTRMQHMLAADPRLQHLQAWEGINPAPRLGLPERGRAERYAEAKGTLDGREHIYPGAFLAHPMEADWPEEEMLLLNQSFCGFSPLGLYNAPSYYRWFVDADKTFGYRYMADLMRLISWTRGDPEDKRWILKNPQHMLDMDTLMKVFPDAQIVFTHRDPLKTVGSVMSLMWFYAVQHTDAPCRAPIRDTWLDFCEQMARRCMQARESIPAGQQIDVQYEDMNRDWRGVMHKLYAYFDMPFTAATETAMASWLAKSDNEKRHGAHRYALEDFGTTEREVDERMMFVRRKYNIPYESK